MGVSLFSQATSIGQEDTGLSCARRGFKLDIRKKFFIGRVIRNLNGPIPIGQGDGESLSLEVFKEKLDVALGAMV